MSSLLRGDMIRGVVVYGHRAGIQDRLEKTFFQSRIPLISHSIVDFSWRRRMIESRDIALAHPEDYLIFLDAWDTMLLGGRDDLEEYAEKHKDSVTFAAQKFCWPDKTREPEYDAIQPEGIGPWRFINSNPMAGKGWRVGAAIEWGWQRFPIQTNTNSCEEYDVDERFLTNLYLSEARERFKIRLDTRCELNQTFLASIPGELWWDHKQARIINKVHNTKPIFIHFNGHTNVPEEML